jgi:hypothetical protein
METSMTPRTSMAVLIVKMASTWLTVTDGRYSERGKTNVIEDFALG